MRTMNSPPILEEIQVINAYDDTAEQHLFSETVFELQMDEQHQMQRCLGLQLS